jgi:hypothetical protein
MVTACTMYSGTCRSGCWIGGQWPTTLRANPYIARFRSAPGRNRRTVTTIGFNPEHAVSISFDLGLQGYKKKAGSAFQQRLLETVSAMPGIQSGGSINNMPLRIGMDSSNITIVGKPVPPASKMKQDSTHVISPGYLKAAGTRLLAGRDIDAHDRSGAPRVALVNETFVKMLLPGENAIGQAFPVRRQRDESSHRDCGHCRRRQIRIAGRGP